MIPCEHCEELINARLDELLTDQEALLLEEHLEQCPDCRKLDRDLTALHIQLLGLAADPPKDLTDAILSQLETPPIQRKKKTPWKAIACAAAAVVLLAVVLPSQPLPFGGAEGDSAAAETAEAPEAADTAGGSRPAEPATQEESMAEPEEDRAISLTEDQALTLLEDYLDQQGLSLEVSSGTLSEDSATWCFSAKDPATGETFRFSVSCSNGSVEEVPLP